MKNTIKAECLKLKNLYSLHLIYLFPLVITAISVVKFIIDMDKNVIVPADNPNYILFRSFYLTFYSFFSPIILTLIYYAVLQTEFKNKAWENLYILIGSKSKIYHSKIFVGVALTMIYVFASLTFMVIGRVIIHFIFPTYFDINNYSVFEELIIYLRYLITYSLLCVIIYNFFFYVENAILSVGFMTFLLLFSAMTLKTEWSPYWPLSFPFRVEGTYIVPDMSKAFLVQGFLVIPIIYVVGLILFKRFFKAKK